MILPKLLEQSIELGPIRPPSEAYSLLIRVTRNCPWNRCQFCSLYKGKRFELRPVEDILNDIKIIKAIKDEIMGIAWKTGRGDSIPEVAAALYNHNQSDAGIRDVALWIWAGAGSAFLQDANTLIMKTKDLLQVITFLKETLPEINRITSYARSKTAAKKTVNELRELNNAGLSRLHIGLESGSDKVLALMNKGVTAAEHIFGGKNVMEAGISLSEYIMPGLGGRKLSTEHALETARVLNEINPDFIRIRTLQINETMPLWAQVRSGEFELQTEDEQVAELRNLIDKLEITGEVKSDHIANMLPEIDGKFPDAKERCLSIMDRYLSLTPEERLNYRLGRRAGYYDSLADFENGSIRLRVNEMIKSIRDEHGGSIEDVINQLKRSFL